MTSTTTDTSTLEPISRAEARGLAEEEYRRWADALGRLGPDDWAKPTDCDGWTVRDMAGHVLGAMRAAASVREQMNQQREIGKRVKASGENQVDVMTALQIEAALRGIHPTPRPSARLRQSLGHRRRCLRWQPYRLPMGTHPRP